MEKLVYNENAKRYIGFVHKEVGLMIKVHYLDVIFCKGRTIVKRMLGDAAKEFLEKVTELNKEYLSLDVCFKLAMKDYDDLCTIFKKHLNYV